MIHQPKIDLQEGIDYVCVCVCVCIERERERERERESNHLLWERHRK